MSKIGPGSLKCVIAWSPQRPLAGPVGEALREHIGREDICDIDGGATLVHTTAAAADIRHWLAAILKANESALVLEFEMWSGYGTAVDRDWLLARGH